YRRAEDEARRTRGEPLAELGPSPGFRDLKWLKPVYMGDTIAFASEVVEVRPSKSRPKWGLMFSHNTGTTRPAISPFLSSVPLSSSGGRPGRIWLCGGLGRLSF